MNVPVRIWLVAGSLALVAVGALGRSQSEALKGARANLHGKAVRSAMSRRFDHVIVIVQENRTVDNLFNGFPGADTVRVGNRFGKLVPLVEAALEPASGGSHRHSAFVSDYDGGKMDGFDWSKGPTTYTYVRESDVDNYWQLASRFTLADKTFQMNMGPSFAAHIFLVAGQGGYPWSVDGNEKGHPVGCYGTNLVSFVNLETQYPGVERERRACVEMPTIFDLLDANGISWHYYAATNGFARNLWTALDYIKHLSKGRAHDNLISPETRVIDDIQNGTLPQVSYVIPEMSTSDHPHHGHSNPLAGPYWVAAVTNALGASQYWSHTLVLVTWDDWGGFYDHVRPPVVSSNTYGFRVPMIIVSAYPKAPGAVDHTQRSQASILTAIESVFNIGSLSQLDAQSDDLSVDFNFHAAPSPYGPPLPAATPKTKKGGSLDPQEADIAEGD